MLEIIINVDLSDSYRIKDYQVIDIIIFGLSKVMSRLNQIYY